ncbi:MAG: hypothetical protein WKG06_11235 [Segetibacter sp.]
MQEVSDDFKRTLDGSADYYAKNINPDSSGEKLVLSEADVNKGNFKHKLASSFQAFNTAIDKSRKYKRNYIFGTDTIRLLIVDTSKNTSDTVKKEIILISQLLEPNIKNLHHDLFDLIMLVKRDTISFASKEEKKSRYETKCCINSVNLLLNIFFPVTLCFGIIVLDNSVPLAIFSLKALPIKLLPSLFNFTEKN